MFCNHDRIPCTTQQRVRNTCVLFSTAHAIGNGSELLFPPLLIKLCETEKSLEQKQIFRFPALNISTAAPMEGSLGCAKEAQGAGETCCELTSQNQLIHRESGWIQPIGVLGRGSILQKKK